MRINRLLFGACAWVLLASCASSEPKSANKGSELSPAYPVPRVVERNLSPDVGSWRVPRQHHDPDLSGVPR